MEAAWMQAQSVILDEADTHGDILLWRQTTDFTNYKDLIPFHWLKWHQPMHLIVISRDDIFVEVIHFSEFISALFGNKVPPESLICDVISSGTLVQQSQRSEVNADNVKNIPDYCNTAAYMLTPDLVPKLLEAASQRQQVRII